MESKKVDGGGKRYDEGKIRLDLIPADALRAVAQVMTMGAAKYGERNFERGMLWSKALGPLLRHVNARQLGEKYDKESGLPHLAHAACNVLFLLAYELRGLDHLDDLEPFVRKQKKRRS